MNSLYEQEKTKVVKLKQKNDFLTVIEEQYTEIGLQYRQNLNLLEQYKQQALQKEQENQTLK